jgi:hypothetical protein
MRGLCFVCLGKGKLERCSSRECASEMQILKGGSKTIFDAVNALGDAVKFQLSRLGHCSFCYLPKSEGCNDFHPAERDGGCLVFKMMLPKALVFGSRCWEERVAGTGRRTERTDPAWLQDVLLHWKMLPEPSKVGFAKMLLSKCETGELWLVRVFYHMLKEAM